MGSVFGVVLPSPQGTSKSSTFSCFSLTRGSALPWILFPLMASLYIDRVGFPILLRKFLAERAAAGEVDNYSATSRQDSGNSSSRQGSSPHRVTDEVRGHILGAFFVGYAISQIPGGVLARKLSRRATERGQKGFGFLQLYASCAAWCCLSAALVWYVHGDAPAPYLHARQEQMQNSVGTSKTSSPPNVNIPALRPQFRRSLEEPIKTDREQHQASTSSSSSDLGKNGAPGGIIINWDDAASTKPAAPGQSGSASTRAVASTSTMEGEDHNIKAVAATASAVFNKAAADDILLIKAPSSASRTRTLVVEAPSAHQLQEKPETIRTEVPVLALGGGRFLAGICQGLVIPAIHQILADECEPRSLANAVSGTVSGMYLGGLVAMVYAADLLEAYGSIAGFLASVALPVCCALLLLLFDRACFPRGDVVQEGALFSCFRSGSGAGSATTFRFDYADLNRGREHVEQSAAGDLVDLAAVEDETRDQISHAHNNEIGEDNPRAPLQIVETVPPGAGASAKPDAGRGALAPADERPTRQLVAPPSNHVAKSNPKSSPDVVAKEVRPLVLAEMRCERPPGEDVALGRAGIAGGTIIGAPFSDDDEERKAAGPFVEEVVFGTSAQNYVTPSKAEQEDYHAIRSSDKALLAHPAVQVILCSSFAFHYAFYLLMSWLPTFLEEFARCGGARQGTANKAAPYGLMFVATNLGSRASNWLRDYYFSRRGGGGSRKTPLDTTPDITASGPEDLNAAAAAAATTACNPSSCPVATSRARKFVNAAGIAVASASLLWMPLVVASGAAGGDEDGARANVFADAAGSSSSALLLPASSATAAPPAGAAAPAPTSRTALLPNVDYHGDHVHVAPRPAATRTSTPDRASRARRAVFEATTPSAGGEAWRSSSPTVSSQSELEEQALDRNKQFGPGGEVLAVGRSSNTRGGGPSRTGGHQNASTTPTTFPAGTSTTSSTSSAACASLAISAAFFGLGFSRGGFGVAHLDINDGKDAGYLIGVVNLAGTLGGVLSVPATGYILTASGGAPVRSGWMITLAVAAAWCLVSAVFFCRYAKAGRL
ncbi:unnamed protein product [Amoebophrya sp. A120]|nr:unnamed protein product [Amoebophrya sp. A120]|eukprot:GSA120T00020638001.1